MGTVDFDASTPTTTTTRPPTRSSATCPQHRSKLVQWAEIDGKQRMIVDNKIFRFIPNPTFDPVARPGLPRRLLPRQGRRATTSATRSVSSSRSTPRTASPTARVKLMDTQGIAGCFLFPTLGVGVEEALLHDPDALHDVFHAFNEWMLDDWTFNYEDRIYAAPYICAAGPGSARSRRSSTRSSTARTSW